MKPYLQATAIALSIWIVAIIINTILVMLLMGFFKTGGGFFDMAGFIIYFSAGFSSPGLFILWFIFMRQLKNEKLFPIVLVASFIGSLLSALILAVFFLTEFGNDGIILFISPVVTALLSVLMHKPFIKRIVEKNKQKLCIETL